MVVVVIGWAVVVVVVVDWVVQLKNGAKKWPYVTRGGLRIKLAAVGWGSYISSRLLSSIELLKKFGFLRGGSTVDVVIGLTVLGVWTRRIGLEVTGAAALVGAIVGRAETTCWASETKSSIFNRSMAEAI